jgi:hypothetical protein
MVICPDVEGLIPSTWANPCVPIGGLQTGMFVVPPIGAKVWVEFEQGDPDKPVWVGYFWGTPAEVPAAALATTPATPVIVLQTPSQAAIVISDTPAGTVPPMPAGGVLLKSGASSILIDPTGVKITAPLVNINQGALLVKLV